VSLTAIEKTAHDLDEARRNRFRQQATGDSLDAYYAAREQDFSHIKPAEDFRDALHDEFHGEDAARGLYLPWRKLDDKFRVRLGELTVWAGFNGHMKSMVNGYVLLDLLRQGQKACVLSFEMKPRKTLRRMACQAVGAGTVSKAYIDKFLDSVAGKLFLYDQQGEANPQRVYAVITYCAEQLGVTQFTVDSLMKVVADEDDYNGQKKFVGKLQSLARDLNVHIHLVTHSRKREDETKRPGKQDNKGSGSIVDQTDNFVSVFKIPPPKDLKEGETNPGPSHCLYFDKQRNGEWEGNLALWMDEASTQFLEGRFDRVRCHV
jgi:twinkle protein